MMSKNNKTSNTALWDQVFQTDPAFTKFVKVGRGFTAIDAFYQVKTATQVFGPVGIGWGWTTDETYSEGLVIVKMHLWYKHPDSSERSEPVVHFGCKALVGKGGRINEDAVKSATTDALTKALSYIGFNGDVFMGMFDDNKYVDAQREKFAAAPEPAQVATPEQLEIAGDLANRISTCGSLGELNALKPELSAVKSAKTVTPVLLADLASMFISVMQSFKEDV
tara:strand:- start:8545 stop:9213 length:669 start_codon:yes stop_codon:yes gene_type:complete